MLAFGVSRRRDRRRLQGQIEGLVAHGRTPASVAAEMIAAHRKPKELREREECAARARADEANERRSWLLWRQMSEAYKALNPWRGQVFEDAI